MFYNIIGDNMKVGNWSNIKIKLNETINDIFSGCDIDSLTDYEKRKIIFEWMCNNITYDYNLLSDIKNFNLNRTPIVRELYLELENVIYNSKGICNAISQYYKLLLEEVGIKAYCVICDDGTLVNHQLNLILDQETGNYSFDDVTSVIVNRGTKEEFFDYDLDYANSVNQGNNPVFDDDYWVVLPEEYIDYLVGRPSKVSDDLKKLPSNITSKKSSVRR